MATVSYNLRDAKSIDKTSIYCFVRYNGKKARIRTGLTVEPANWYAKKHRCHTKRNRVLFMEYNSFLNRLEEDILTEFYKFVKENKREPEPKEIKILIEHKYYGISEKSPIPKDFFGYWDYYINNQRRATSPKTGKLITQGTIQNYVNARHKLKEYEKTIKGALSFKTIDLDFYYSFIEYLEDEGLSKNTIGKQIKILSGPCEHKEFLAEANGIDPRPNFIKQLISDCEASGSIVVYNQGFEMARLNELSRAFPEYADALQTIVARIVDLMRPFQQHAFYKKEMRGSYSIKSVLPAIVSTLSYNDLSIADGGTASQTFFAMFQDSEKFEEGHIIEDVREDLLKYCERDTWAMVVLMEKLNKLILA